MTRNTSYAVELRAGDPVPGASTWIGGITDQSINTGVQVNTEVTAGSENPSYGEIGNIQPGASITSGDIATLLGQTGMKGVCLIGATDLGFKLWGLRRKACGAIDTSGTPGVHRSWTIPNGFMVPQSLSAQHGSRASVTAAVFSLWDGTNDSLIIAKDLAAPSGTFPSDVNGFHLGPVSLAGITFIEKTSVNIGWNISVQPQIADGDTVAKSLFIAEFKPTVTITCHDVDKFDATGIPLEGLHGTHANTSIVLRKKVVGSGAYMSGANHLELTIDGVAAVQSISASGHAPHAMQVTLTGMDDNTNDMLVADFAHTLV